MIIVGVPLVGTQKILPLYKKDNHKRRATTRDCPYRLVIESQCYEMQS